MTCGFVAISLGVAAYGTRIGVALPGGVGVAAVSNGVATLAAAALPLGSTDVLHGLSAAVAYATLVSTPLVGARSLARQGRRRAAGASVVVGVGSAAALLASVLVSSGSGLWQRIGLTVAHAWIMATALWLFFGLPTADGRSR